VALLRRAWVSAQTPSDGHPQDNTDSNVAYSKAIDAFRGSGSESLTGELPMTIVASLALAFAVLASNQSPLAPTPAPTQPDAVPAPTPAVLGPHMTASVNLDPERPAPIVGWWSNGTQLLDVAPGGAYRLFASQSRYLKPIEVGRWHRQNYAAFWLDPYSARKEQRTRVALSKIDDALVVTVRNFEPMTRSDAPPVAEEDFVIGLWLGAGGSLDLQPTMRYHFVAPQRPSEGRPVVIASHRGTWHLEGGRVELIPDSPSVATVLFEPIRDAEGRPYMRLRGVEGVLDRIAERSATPVAQPPSSPATPPNTSPATSLGNSPIVQPTSDA